MKKSINLIFQVHQPCTLRRYRFFDIGNDHYYYDDYASETITEWLSRQSYLPATSMLLRKIVQLKGALKVTFYISGVALEMFQKYSPSVIESFKRLEETGHVEFLCGTWSNSPASIRCRDTFKDQIDRHKSVIVQLFGQVPVTFYNAELIYSDDIGSILYDWGFKAAIVEGAKPVLGWRSPDMLYSNAIYPQFKLLMRNRKICDKIDGSFGEHQQGSRMSPSELIAEIEKTVPGEQVVNLSFDLALLGSSQTVESGIFTYMETLLTGLAKSDHLQFSTPSETAKNYPPAALLSVPHSVSWADEKNDITSLIGNDLQKEALNQLFGLSPRILKCENSDLLNDYNKLQTTNHFYYMSTRYYEKEVSGRPNPYQTAHEAFVNYMNIISDFKLRLEK
jgi:alpha-amylase